MFARAILALTRLTLVCGLVLLCAVWLTSSAQVMPSGTASPQPTPNEKRTDSVDFGSREIDTRTRLALKAEKKAYEEHVARAREARDLAAELQKTHEKAHIFNAADYKKLERLEKLTRRIRNEVGGSHSDADPKELPKTTDEAVTLLANMAAELCEEVEKTPRRVVSAAIIEQANKLIIVVQYLRPRD